MSVLGKISLLILAVAITQIIIAILRSKRLTDILKPEVFTLEYEANDSNKKTLEKWSAEALMENDALSMLIFPKEDWPSYAPTNHDSCPFNLRFFVVELPDTISTEVEDYVKGMLRNGTKIRSEVSMEFALKQLFETSPCRTYNISTSDLYIVPYMHSADCDYNYDRNKGSIGCNQVKTFRINMVRSSAPAFVPIERQVFISMGPEEATRDHLRFPMADKEIPRPIKSKITTGDRQHNGIFAMPTLNLLPRFQPSILSKRDEQWWTRPRKYAFAAMYGQLNHLMKPYSKQARCFRSHFFNHLNRNFIDQENFADTGLPYLARYTERKKFIEKNFKFQYEDSILCPILAGDSPYSMRFFDVIFDGCIPVVLEWNRENLIEFGEKVFGENDKTWWIPNRVYSCVSEDPDKRPHGKESSSIVHTYPFISSLSTYNNTDDITNQDWAIDYRSFVITAPGNASNQSDMTALFDAMISVLKDPKELRRRQLNMMKYATRLTLGVGLDAHKYDDAFAGVLKLLELYKDGL